MWKKRGDFLIDNVGWLILTLVVLAIAFGAYMILGDSSVSILERVKGAFLRRG